jgi:hypothetical protein
MNTIYKYPLEITDVQTIRVPKKNAYVDVLVNGDKLAIYFIVDKEELDDTKDATIRIVGTGNSFPDWNWDSVDNNLIHIKTVQQGPFVWHVFGVLDK